MFFRELKTAETTEDQETKAKKEEETNLELVERSEYRSRRDFLRRSVDIDFRFRTIVVRTRRRTKLHFD